MKKLLILLLTLFLFSCGDDEPKTKAEIEIEAKEKIESKIYYKKETDHLRYGMTTSQVDSLMGDEEPASVIYYSDFEVVTCIWRYGYSGNNHFDNPNYSLKFVNDTLVGRYWKEL